MSDHRPLVAHIIHHLGVGGLENGLVNLVNTIPMDRYRHAIICLAGYDEFAERISNKDVRLFDLGKRRGKDFACYVRLFKLLRQLRPQIVHTRNIGTLDCQFVAAVAGKSYRIHGEHGWDVGDIDGTLDRYVLIRRFSRAFVHQYMTVSKHMVGWLENVIGIPVRKITQVYNGIDAEKFRPRRVAELSNRPFGEFSKDEVVIGTVGRLDPIKDQMTLLRALDLLVKRLPNGPRLRLEIVGAGEMQQELTQFVCDRQLDSLVTFVGNSDDVASHLRDLDLFVLPSLNEGISNTILEAMATGLPVIASRAGGNPELVHEHETGSLFSPGDDEALADLMLSYVENRQMRCERGAAGRTRVVEQFGLDRMTARYVALYDQGIDHSGFTRAIAG